MNYSPTVALVESGVGLVSLLDQLSLRQGTSTGENNGKLYWHKSQGLKWGKAKLEVYREKKIKIKSSNNH